MYLARFITGKSVVGNFAFQGFTSDEHGGGSGRASALGFRFRVRWDIDRSNLFVDKDVIGKDLGRGLFGG